MTSGGNTEKFIRGLLSAGPPHPRGHTWQTPNTVLAIKTRTATNMRASKHQAPAIAVITESYSKRENDICVSGNGAPSVPTDPAC
ncbi:hypothetical protein A4G27_22325 [Mycobacterium kansasii]|nr:hypothetical protein A4G27_22325 [Mycobacterium kansasii]